MKAINAEFPHKLKPLFESYRYKTIIGGRGKGASWGIARALLILGASKPLRIVCGREFQKSIDDSVHALLKGQIARLGYDAFYDVQKTEINGINGTQFTFHGLKHNVNNIKSLEGADICWVAEGQAVSNNSWETLIPTIRKDGSEIWTDFNPELEEDDTYQRFVINPPTNSVLIRMSWRDNPWFNAILEQERTDLFSRDPEKYKNVWEGECKRAVEGAIFAEQLGKAEAEERLTSVPYNPARPVSTFWDLGWSDKVAIWFVQKVGFEYRVIDYLEDNQKTLAYFITELQKKGYVYDKDWLPHDARHKTLAAGGKSLEQQAIDLGRKADSIPVLPLETQINLARTIFPTVHFDRKKCADGIQALRHYQYKVDPQTKLFSKEPLHNWASHGASAFMGFAVSANDRLPKKPKHFYNERQYSGAGNASWMEV